MSGVSDQFMSEVSAMNVRDLVPWGKDRERNSSQSASLGSVVNLHREMNRFFDEVFRGFDDSGFFGGRSAWPSVDVDETEKEYRVTAELPGLDERDVEVFLHEGVLTVRGEKKMESEDRNRSYSERFFGRFERRIPLERNIDEGAVSAIFKNGVLTVKVPKNAKAIESSKRIPINK
jgi:HSP20 family protein